MNTQIDIKALKTTPREAVPEDLRLRWAMLQVGHSNISLANEVYASHTTINYYVQRKTSPNVYMAHDIARALGEPLEWLWPKETEG